MAGIRALGIAVVFAGASLAACSTILGDYPDPQIEGDGGDAATDGSMDVGNDSNLPGFDATTDGSGLDGGMHDAMPDAGGDVDAAEAGCQGDQRACEAGCVALTDPHNCGGCGTDCSDLPHVTGLGCAANACTYQCEPGWADCADSGTGCTTDLTQAGTCGSCTNACGGGTPDCVSSGGTSSCASGCPGSQALCGTTCSDTTTDPNHCGSCTNACTAPNNAVATCAGSTCGFTCNASYHDCNGTCADNTSTNTCGSSCTACQPPANSTPSCDGSNCGYTCNAGFHDCSGTCVADSSTTMCGASCTACQPPANSMPTCNGISCGFTCNGGYDLCGGACVLNTTTTACGASCTNCPVPSNSSGATCDGTSCGFTCSAGYAVCGSACCAVTQISVGGEHACAIGTNGLKCWGGNSSGQLGDGNTNASHTAIAVSGIASTAVTVSAGGNHTCAITNAGALYCWGDDSDGQLGDSANNNTSSPGLVPGFTTGTIAVATGADTTCAIKVGGAVYCWGVGADGQLGDGAMTGSNAPMAVSGLSSGALAISVGFQHACALTSTEVLCWGSNQYGQLGDNSMVSSDTPIAVPGLASQIQVVCGETYTCARASGGIYCWGSNSYGQLGNNSTTTVSLYPVPLMGFAGSATAIAGEDAYHTCLIAAGGVECWGYNNYGQLGDNSTSNSEPPQAVSGLSSGVSSIGTGGYNSCGMTAAGVAYCWGYNGYGQLGDNSTNNSPTPIQVQGL